MNRFATLLKREYWEHKGGLLWAPLWTGLSLVFFTIVGLLIATSFANKAGVNIQVGVNLGTLLNGIATQHLAEIRQGFDAGMLGFAAIVQLVFAIVVFFYCIGSLYDDRKDRSVLFWKSMPVSDGMTVISKVTTVMLIAPLFAFATIVLTHVLFLMVITLFVLFHSGNPIDLVIGPAEPLVLWAKIATHLLINSLWILPSIGWLMLASSFARSKAFLWAVFPPLMVGVFWNITELWSAMSLPNHWIWTKVIGRLFPFVPSYAARAEGVKVLGIGFGNNGPTITWEHMFGLLWSTEMLLGIIAGLTMLYAASWFRRYRELAD